MLYNVTAVIFSLTLLIRFFHPVSGVKDAGKYTSFALFDS